MACLIYFNRVNRIYTITHYPLEDIALHEALWGELYKQSDASVFLNWSWIKAWLTSIDSVPVVLAAYENTRCVGLAFLTQRNARSSSRINIKQLWLHRKGEQASDQMWIEHNDFLVHQNNKEQIRLAMLEYLFAQKKLWHELYFGLTNSKVIDSLKLNWPSCREVISSPDFEVDLRHKANLNDYLADLSKNTRSQIRRTKKLLTQSGELELTLAQTAAQKETFLEDISRLHKDKWRDTEFGSGFDNPIFEQFHRHLIFEDDVTNKTRLYCLTLDKKPIAYIYLLIDDDTWYFYLSAINGHDDNRVKVGLIAHAYMIEQAIAEKVSKYSFLAGEARYKRSLSNLPETSQTLVCFYQPTVFMRLRECARRYKNALPNILRH